MNESKGDREVMRCRNCGEPLGTKNGNTIQVRKYSRGKPVSVDIDIRHSGSGVVQIHCTKCKGIVTGHTFVTLRLSEEEDRRFKALTKKDKGIK